MPSTRRFLTTTALGFFLFAWQPISASSPLTLNEPAQFVALQAPPIITNCEVLENILSAPTQPFGANERFHVENTGSNIPNGAVFNWNFSGANVISGSDKGPYTLSFPSPGLYTISVSYSALGCITRTVSRQIEITPECEAVPTYSAGTVTTSMAQINWTNATPEQGFVLNYRPQGSPNWLSKAVPTGTTNSWLTSLQQLTAYEFVVRRICGSGRVSSLQDQPLQTFTTNNDPDVCDPPANLQQLTATNNSLFIGWDAAPAAVRYIVQIRNRGTTTWRNRTVKSALSRSHTFTNLLRNTPYDIWLYGECPGGQPSSNVIISTNTTGGIKPR
jgi:hypothetical protein